MSERRFAGWVSSASMATAFIALVCLSSARVAWAADTAAPQEQTARQVPQFLRVVADEGRSVALEIASVDFVPGDDARPAVSLVGVVHIGDQSYYRAVQNLLEGYDVVLYESVKPAGTGGAAGRTEEQRIDGTRAALGFVGRTIASYHARQGRYPAHLEELRAFAQSVDPRLLQFLDEALADGWGRPLVYERPAEEPATAPEAASDAAAGEPVYALLSRGADGRPGGEGAAADLLLDDPAGVQPLTAFEEDGLQAQLADALDLEFQLDALNYGGTNWHCSDMSIDQLQREMEKRGLDFSLVEDTLAGSSLPAQLVKLLLGVVRMADAFFEGAVSDTIKVLLIEMLGDESVLEIGFSQFDEGFAEVIIDERNQIVIDDLKQLIERETPLESVAILYGAGHMPDMARRLGEQLGYEPNGARWLRAIEVDLTESAVSETDVKRLRLLVRRMLHQMNRLNKAGSGGTG